MRIRLGSKTHLLLNIELFTYFVKVCLSITISLGCVTLTSRVVGTIISLGYATEPVLFVWCLRGVPCLRGVSEVLVRC